MGSRFAIVFPGQGAQEVGMACDFRDAYPVAKQTFEEADDALGWSISRLIAEGPDSELKRTEITQPAVLTASLAIYRVLEPELPTPVCFAGHSLGEYSALVAAGVLGLGDAVRLVNRRGAFMQEAVPEGQGDMAVVLGLPGDVVARICAETEGVVVAANFNAPEQTAIAGLRDSVRAAGEALKKAGAKRVLPLQVSAPFHSPLMAPAAERLAALLAETPLQDARVPVLSNVTAEPYRTAAEARELLARQAASAVRWVDSVRKLGDLGAKLQLELGPGSVLSGLARNIAPTLARASVSKLDGLPAARAALEAARA